MRRFLRSPCAAASLLLPAALLASSCKPKITPAQCDALVDRYARLVVTEKRPDAGPEAIKVEQERERSEARGDDAFKNCTSEVSRAEFDCAMSAPTADALEKCLE